jgi:hypothetical protein
VRRLALFLAGLLGCTNTSVVAPRATMALAQSTTGDIVRLPTENGGTVEFGPNATLHIDGIDVPASELYWSEQGVLRKNGDVVASWHDLRSITVEQIDGAATVGISATAAIGVILVAALLKGAPSGGGGGPKGSGGSAPKASGGSAGRSAPNPPSVERDPVVPELVFRGVEAMVRPPYLFVDPGDAQPDTDVAIPLFSAAARRRANIRALARLEGGACWPSGPNTDCVVGGVRAGVRIVDLVELTAGVRTETMGGTTKPLALAGFMLHGESPAAHWIALAVGASVAFDGARAHVIPTLAVRFRPLRGLWLGLVPLEPVYATETGNWSLVSGAEITGEL